MEQEGKVDVSLSETGVKSILGLLQEHDCVIVPGFGGFVLNEASARFSSSHDLLLPPAKTLSFNRNLRMNDGLLAHAVCESEKLSYAEAQKTIARIAEDWLYELKITGQLKLPGLGRFNSSFDGRFDFAPDTENSFSRLSYGLAPVQLFSLEIPTPGEIYFPILKKAQRDVRSQAAKAHILKKKRSGSQRIWIKKTLAILTVASVLFVIGSVAYNNNPDLNSYVAGTLSADSFSQFASSVKKKLYAPLWVIGHQNHASDTKPQTTSPRSAPASSPIISDLHTNILQKLPHKDEEHFYVIGGFFSRQTNALAFSRELERKGFVPQLLHTSKGRFYVAYTIDSDSLSAISNLQSIRNSENADAWLLKQ